MCAQQLLHLQTSRVSKMTTSSAVQLLREKICAASATHTPLCIRGGGSKDFYGGTPHGELLDTRTLEGIVEYEPTELVMTARAGTLLTKIESTLAANQQCLAFEPPYFSAQTTLGGCVAAGLSGPRRAANGLYYGSIRDFLLGCRVLDGRGDELSFGGQVMKNVAGYDVARLMAGSLGTLGVLTEISLKVLPLPVATCTLQFSMAQAEAIQQLNRWAGLPLPITASVWFEQRLTVRLEGAHAAVQSAVQRLGGSQMDALMAREFWQATRNHTADFFQAEAPLWRLSVPAATPPLSCPSIASASTADHGAGQWIEWGGAQRWCYSDAPAAQLHALAQSVGGHAIRFRSPTQHRDAVVGAFDPVLARVHRDLKQRFDPAGIFNPGRMFSDF